MNCFYKFSLSLLQIYLITYRFFLTEATKIFCLNSVLFGYESVYTKSLTQPSCARKARVIEYKFEGLEQVPHLGLVVMNTDSLSVKLFYIYNSAFMKSSNINIMF